MRDIMRFSPRKLIVALLLVGFLVGLRTWYTASLDPIQQQRAEDRAEHIAESVYNEKGKLEPTSPPLRFFGDVKLTGSIVDLKQAPRVAEYCNPPGAKMKGDEGEVAENFELKLVHVLIRHGDRSPISNIKNHPNYKLHCRLDNSTVTRNKALSKFLDKMSQQVNRSLHNDFRDWDLYPNEEKCGGGQLTPLGMFQHIQTGRYLRRKYTGKLFNGSLNNDNIHIRSTSFTRTYQSAIALLYGLTPRLDLSTLKIKKSVSLHFCSEQMSGLSCFCSVTSSLRQKAENAAGEFNRVHNGHKILYKRLAEIYNVRSAQLPWLSTIMDVLMSHVCHQVALPCGNNGKCINQRLMETIWKTLDEDNVLFKLQNQNYVIFSHLILHPLLVEIMQRMRKVINAKPTPKFVLYSGHDITVQPLVTALGIHDGKWPPYASKLVIEFYSKKINSGFHYFIRILFNGKDKTKQLSFCQYSTSRLHGLCKFEHFEKFVKTHLRKFDIVSYRQACTSE